VGAKGSSEPARGIRVEGEDERNTRKHGGTKRPSPRFLAPVAEPRLDWRRMHIGTGGQRLEERAAARRVRVVRGLPRTGGGRPLTARRPHRYRHDLHPDGGRRPCGERGTLALDDWCDKAGLPGTTRRRRRPRVFPAPRSGPRAGSAASPRR
jgi:hypothetical protein